MRLRRQGSRSSGPRGSRIQQAPLVDSSAIGAGRAGASPPPALARRLIADAGCQASLARRRPGVGAADAASAVPAAGLCFGRPAIAAPVLTVVGSARLAAALIFVIVARSPGAANRLDYGRFHQELAS